MGAMLQKRMESRAQGQGGFTLIELLVVIAILAVLAGVVVFAVGGIADNSQDSACEIDERTVKTAVEAYRAQEGEYPPNEATLVPGFLDEESTFTNYTLAGGVPQYAPGPDC